MARRAFFFPHSYQPDTKSVMGRPGRVPYKVTGQLVDGTSLRTAEFVVIGDGYAADVPGPNQDPCIFAERAPIHSFCRVDSRRIDNWVRGTSNLLTSEVGQDAGFGPS